MDSRLAVVIMAAGKGTRMKNPDIAKVLYAINGRPMIDYVVNLALRLEAVHTVAIVGWKRESVNAHLQDVSPSVTCVVQDPQLGTGHAVMQAQPPLEGFTGDVLILSGDVPLLSYATARGLLDYHRACGGVATVLTARLPDPTGYGRILRGRDGAVTEIVEHKDATEEQRAIHEINTGIYVFRAPALFEGLQHLTTENAQKEYYLTDIFRYFFRNDLKVCAVESDDPLEIRGINTLEQLEEARIVMERSHS